MSMSMSNTMTAHEPINYLDSILNEEEKRCEYGHQWRSYTISRSGRFKSKNKKRDIVDGKLFDKYTNSTSSPSTTSSSSQAQSSFISNAATMKIKDDRHTSYNNHQNNINNNHNNNHNASKEQEKYLLSRHPLNSTKPGSSFSSQQQQQQHAKGLRENYYETNL